MNRFLGVTLVLLFLIVAACSTSDVAPVSIAPFDFGSDAPPVPNLDLDRVAAGEILYQQNCAACHGVDLAGQENWKSRDADGFLPAPPQDSSGHTWHHADELILEIVSEGLDLGPSRMPTFGSQLSEEEISSIVEFLKSTWGDEERAFQWYITWQETQQAN